MAVDLEKILRPVDNPLKPFEAKYRRWQAASTW